MARRSPAAFFHLLSLYILMLLHTYASVSVHATKSAGITAAIARTHADIFTQRLLPRHFLTYRQPTSPALYSDIVDNDTATSPFHLAALSVLRQSSVDQPKFTSGPTLSSNQVGLTDGSASESIYFIFRPEPGKTIDDYDLSFASSTERCLVAEDFKIGAVQQISGGYNITAAIDYNRWVGVTDIRVVAVDKNTSVTTTSEKTTCTIVGMTFYTFDGNGNQIIVGGPNHPLNVTTEQLRNDSKIDLNCFIQYPDGTDSSESLNGNYPMSGITISTTSVENQISHNPLNCQDTGNQFDGSTVQFDRTCAYGFSQNDFNSSYVGPKFGLNLNPSSNGSFDIICDWPGLVTGSDLESIGYETSINVIITGDVVPAKPSVARITPAGPFGITGEDKFTVELESIPGDAAILQDWAYKFGIIFENGTIGYADLIPGGIKIVDNSTATVDFRVPPGTGVNLGWNFTITTPTGEVIVVEDKTDPSFLFTLKETILLESITPNNGSEQGGDTVKLSGFFPNFDPANSTILFGGIPITQSDIISSSEQDIIITVPQRTSQDYNTTVSVQIDGTTSNSLEFIYFPETTIKKLTPAYGTEEGGTEVTIEGFFSKFNISTGKVIFGGVELDGSAVTFANETHIVFTTPPRSSFGNSSQYLYDVTVKTPEDTSNSMKFSYQVPISITALTPSNGPETGGTVVTMTGSFGGFNFESGSIYMGGQKLNASNLLSATSDTITFTTPPRSEIGSAASQEVWISYLNVESNRLPFTYWAPGLLTIDVTGPVTASGDGFYYASACGNADFRASISPGARAANPVIEWTLVDPANSGVDILAQKGITRDQEIIVLPRDVYPKKNTEYILTLNVQTDFARVQQRLTLVQREAESLGVRIIDPRPLSFSNPNVTLTIPAVLSTCITTNLTIDYPAITYIWDFREKSYLFSYLNLSSPRGIVGPTLLGREFQIPQKWMEYGRFPIKLTAFYTNYTQVRGSDSSLVVIRPAPLLAQINGGEATQFISEGSNFEISGAKSRDPDVLEGDATANIRYEWACMYSTDPSFATNTTCGDNLRPSIDAKTFTVQSSAFQSARTDGKNTYVQYTLVVTKTSVNATGANLERVSMPVSSVFVLPAATGKKYEPFVNFEIKNNQSILMDPMHIKYYEDVIITPVSKTADSTWEFELSEPQSQSKLLQNPMNLIPYFGFYTINSRADRHSLGIMSNKLKPNTRYTFKVSSFRDGFERNEQTLVIKTVEEPSVQISHFPKANGSIGTTFHTAASTNYAGDFKYYFIVTDQFGYQYCVDGCQGVNVARFQLASAGIYNIRCDVYDSLGYTLLATTNETRTITVAPRSPPLNLEQMSKYADDAFLAGDHALYQQYANDMVKFILDQGNATSTNSTLDTEIVKNLTRKIGQITANSVPNPIQSATFVRTATSIARLTPEQGIYFDTETMYILVNITSNAIARTPDNAALQQLEDVLQFYDLAPQLLQQTFSAVSNTTAVTVRTSVRQQSNASNINQVRVVWADMYELMKNQITMILLKGAVCGAKQSVRTGKPSAAQNALSLRFLTARQASEQQSTNKSGDGQESEPGTAAEDEANPDVEEKVEEMEPLESPESMLATTEGRNVPNATVKLNPTQGQLRSSLFQVAKLCNPEQGLELFIDENTKDEVRFKSCPAVFKNSFRTLLFSVVSTPDYVWLSGLQQVETRADGLVSVSVAEQKAGNKLVEEGTRERSCYEVEFPVLTTSADLEKDDTNGSTIGGLRFAPIRVWNTVFDSLVGYYYPGYRDTRAKLVRTKDSKRALITAARTGIYSVRAGRDRLRGVHWWWIIVLGTIACILATAVIVGAIVHFSTPPEERVAGDDALAVPVDTDMIYVERDIYGRGTAVEMLDPQNAAAADAALGEEDAAIGAVEAEMSTHASGDVIEVAGQTAPPPPPPPPPIPSNTQA